MIIGIDASRANRQYKTGTEWYSYYLIKNFAEIDNKNQYRLYSDRPFGSDLKKIIADHPNFTGKVLRWPWQYFWTLGRLTLEMVWHQPRVLFVPAHSIPLICPRRTITTIHDIAFKKEEAVYTEQTIDRGRHFLRYLIVFIVKHILFLAGKGFKYDPTAYLDWSTRYALRHAKKIITVSHNTKKEIVEVYKTNPDKIKVIHNGYDDSFFKKIADRREVAQVLDRYGLNFPYLLSVGRLEKKKNIPMLIEALALLKENNPEIKTKLVLIGHAGFGYDEIKYIIEEYNLNSEVIMLGWVAEADLPGIYNGALAFVFPSRHEGFGIPVMQALACGLPSAISDIPVLREVAEDSVLYFDKDSKEDIALKLKVILTDENLRTKLAQSGLKRAQQFSWRKCAEETLKEIKGL
ncbi:MAG: glycosyltransferase family 1 protein [Patescibacteria group bacterium]